MNTPVRERLRSVDLVRGIACVLMAIDHVRVYSGIPAGGPTPGVFLTRWVTHFVAPAFALLAGTAAWFLGKRLADTGALRRFLVSRGLLLVLLELTLIRWLWSASWNPSAFTLAGVIWMLGWCMVLLAAFVGLTVRTIAISGIVLAGAQQLLALPPRALPAAVAPWWAFVYPSGADPALGINVLYVLVPWIGVMLCGYALGSVLERPEADRRRWLSQMGGGMTLAFVLLATVAAITTASSGGEAAGDATPPLWMRVLNQQKYPASQLFLLMTLGPALWLLPWAERARGRLADAMVTFGRVPMFYYLAHIAAIHAAALLVNRIRLGAAHAEWFTTAPYTGIPPEGQWSLGLLYLVWAVVVGGVLYPACAWYARVKAARPDSWLRFL
jgi:uncharacterized membrane protein